MIISATFLCTIGMIIHKTLGDSGIECFGLRCPPGSVQCVYEEKSMVANATVIGEASCMDRESAVMLRKSFRWPNPKGDVVLNQYQFYGPGIYTKERVNYARKGVFKRSKTTKVTMENRLEDMRKKIHEDFAEKLRGNVMNKW